MKSNFGGCILFQLNIWHKLNVLNLTSTSLMDTWTLGFYVPRWDETWKQNVRFSGSMVDSLGIKNICVISCNPAKSISTKTWFLLVKRFGMNRDLRGLWNRTQTSWDLHRDKLCQSVMANICLLPKHVRNCAKCFVCIVSLTLHIHPRSWDIFLFISQIGM